MPADEETWRADPNTKRVAAEWRKQRDKAGRQLVQVALMSSDPTVRATAERHKALVEIVAKLERRQASDQVKEEEDL